MTTDFLKELDPKERLRLRLELAEVIEEELIAYASDEPEIFKDILLKQLPPSIVGTLTAEQLEAIRRELVNQAESSGSKQKSNPEPAS